MEHDPFRDLIGTADRAAPPPVVAPGLAGRVFLRARRRALRQKAIVLLALAGSCGAVFFHSMAKSKVTIGTQPANIAEIRAELARLDADVQRHQHAASEARLREQEFLSADFLDLAPKPDSLQQINHSRDSAAMTLLRWADRTAAQSGGGKAAAIYSDAANLFPNSPAGRTAAERLKPAGNHSNL